MSLNYLSERSEGVCCGKKDCKWYDEQFDQCCCMADHNGDGDPGPAFCEDFIPWKTEIFT